MGLGLRKTRLVLGWVLRHRSKKSLPWPGYLGNLGFGERSPRSVPTQAHYARASNGSWRVGPRRK